MGFEVVALRFKRINFEALCRRRILRFVYNIQFDTSFLDFLRWFDLINLDLVRGSG